MRTGPGGRVGRRGTAGDDGASVGSERVYARHFDARLGSRISASKALAYATSGEMLTLYAVLVGGWLLTLVGQFVMGTTYSAGLSLVAGLAVLAGGVAVLVAVVAIVYKLLADSRSG